MRSGVALMPAGPVKATSPTGPPRLWPLSDDQEIPGVNMMAILKLEQQMPAFAA